MNSVGPQEVTVTLGGMKLEPRRFPKLAWQVEQWDLPPAPAGQVEVTFDTERRGSVPATSRVCWDSP